MLSFQNRISTADYRKQFVNPALSESRADEAFMKQLQKPTTKKNKISSKLVGESEHDIQKRILERLGFLKKDGFFWRENSGQFALESKGKKRFFRAGVTGIADIMGIYKGRGVAIEVKRPETKDKVSLTQKAFLQRYRECGGIAFVCDDDKEVIKLLESAYGEKK